MDDNILEQFEETTPSTTVVKKGKKKTTTPEIEEKREQLSILAVLGTIDEYTGQKLSLGDVKKLSPTDVEKFHNRYQVKIGNEVSKNLIDMSLEGATEIINYLLPIDDKKELCNDLKKNELLKQELNNAAGFTILKGGRFVALGTAVVQIIKHLKLNTSVAQEALKSA